MNIPEDLKYSKDHEWIKVEGTIGTIGISDYAQGELGDVIYIDIPSESVFKQGDTFGTIEAVKTVSDLFAPVSGKIIEINKAVNDDPSVVNRDPYGKGWLVKFEISNAGELDALLDADAYRKLVGA